MGWVALFAVTLCAFTVTFAFIALVVVTMRDKD